MKKVLVFGGGGSLCCYVADELTFRHYDVVVPYVGSCPEAFLIIKL